MAGFNLVLVKRFVRVVLLDNINTNQEKRVVPHVHPVDIQQQLVNQVVQSAHLVNIQHTKQLHV